MFEKICEVSARPKKVSKVDEAAIAPQNRMTGKKVQNLIKVLYQAKTKNGDLRKSSLTKQEFMLLLRTICHPQISQRTQDLKLIMETLTDLLFKQAELNSNQDLGLFVYFERHLETIIQYALVQRSGILSPNLTLRAIAKNMLICLGW